MTARYMHLSPAAKDAAIKLLDERPLGEGVEEGMEAAPVAASEQGASRRIKDFRSGLRGLPSRWDQQCYSRLEVSMGAGMASCGRVREAAARCA